jgi:hypothetical protein
LTLRRFSFENNMKPDRGFFPAVLAFVPAAFCLA